MSIEALNWALDTGDREDLEPTTRHILLVLANRADEEGYVYPSVGWIRRRTGYAKSTINDHLKKMADRTPALISIETRQRDDGAQTSNLYKLALQQPGLQLGNPPSGRRSGGAAKRMEGQRLAEGAPPTGGPYTQDKTKEETKGSRAGQEPSPVSLAFQAYSAGIKARYGADYPPSAKANGQLAQVVKRVGAENAVAVVQAFLASPNAFYPKVKHRLDCLTKDCEQIYLELQATTAGGTKRIPTEARVALLAGDESVLFECQRYPAGDMEQIAKRAAKEYASRIQRLDPAYVSVVQGTERRRYKPEELRP